jgi:hypothetical protein
VVTAVVTAAISIVAIKVTMTASPVATLAAIIAELNLFNLTCLRCRYTRQ